MNADLLSEMILQDMVNDVAHDLHGNNQDKVATNEARVMMDAPDLETVMQRLQQMEVSNETAVNDAANGGQ